MCGITGYITTRPNTAHIAKSKMAGLLLASQVRGDDACGIAFVKNEKLQVIKDGVKASLFVESKEFKQAIDKNSPNIMIGHTRAKTQGSFLNNKNNHPLFSEGIAIVHNGMISNDDEVFKNFKLKRDGEVDSEAILKLITYYKSKHLVTRMAIQQAIGKIQGSLAVAVINAKNDRELHLVRSNNPICTAYHKPTGIIYFASTYEILIDGLSEHKTVFFIFDEIIDNTSEYLFCELDDNTGYRLTADKITAYKIDTKSWVSNYNREHNSDIKEAIHEASADYFVKQPKYIKITDFTLPIKKPSRVSSDDLEFRLAMLEQNIQNGIMTSYDQAEIKRIDNCLADRFAKENAKNPKKIVSTTSQDEIDKINETLDQTNQEKLACVN